MIKKLLGYYGILDDSCIKNKLCSVLYGNDEYHIFVNTCNYGGGITIIKNNDEKILFFSELEKSVQAEIINQIRKA